MKIEKIKKEDSIVYYYSFDNLYQLADYVETAKLNDKIFFRFASNNENPEKEEWCGTKTFDEAVQLCRYGDYRDFDQFIDLNTKLEKGMPRFTHKRNIIPNSYGHRPDIRKAIMGNPNSMLFLVRNEQYKFVHIYYNVNTSFNSVKSQFVNRGIATINMIRFLENIGYRVRLDFFQATHLNNEYFYANVNIKNEGEKLDVASCYFPMCNPAFLRRILFRVLESTPVEYQKWGDGYGLPMDTKETKYFLGVDDDNSIVISETKEIGIRGYDIFSDAERMFDSVGLNRFLPDGQRIIYDQAAESFSLSKKF